MESMILAIAVYALAIVILIATIIINFKIINKKIDLQRIENEIKRIDTEQKMKHLMQFAECERCANQNKQFAPSTTIGIEYKCKYKKICVKGICVAKDKKYFIDIIKDELKELNDNQEKQ